jgi:hypothetical protein
MGPRRAEMLPGGLRAPGLSYIGIGLISWK